MSAAVEMRKVNSSMFSEVGYSEDSWVLTVIYKSSGLRLDYQSVEPELFDEMMAAASMGKFFNGRIKGKYQAIGEEVAQQAGDPPLSEMDRDIALAEPGWNGKEIVRTSDAAELADEVLGPVEPEPQKMMHLSEIGTWPKEGDKGYIESPLPPFGAPAGVSAELTKYPAIAGEVLSAWHPPENALAAIIALNERQGEIQAIIRANDEQARDALSTTVTDGLSHASAGQVLTNLVNTKDRCFKLLDPIRAKLYETYQMAGDQQKKALASIDSAVAHVKRVMLTWEMAEERERQRKVREAQEEADRQARELQQAQSQQLTLAEIGDAIEAGDTEKAESLFSAPIEVPKPYIAPVPVMPTYLPPEGQSTRKNWTIAEDEIDLVKFLRAVKDGKLEIDKAAQFILPNLPALKRLAKALETAFDIPGFRAFNEPVKSVRRTK